MRKTTILSLLFSTFLFTSCGNFMTKMAVGTTASLLAKASYEMETESNWQNLEKGMIANLKTVEALVYLKPDDKELLVTLTKGYAGYAFTVNETLYLYDQFEEKEKSFNKDQLIFNYSRAFRYGLRFLKENGIEFQNLVDAMKTEGALEKLFDKELSDDTLDLEGVLYTGQSLGGMINYQKTNMKMVTLLPMAKGMFDWVCKKRPDIGHGICDLFYGAYESGRPRMMGGNPKLGKKRFLNMIKKYPNNWLARLAYVQYYLIPQYDEEGYKLQKPYLEKALELHNKEMKWLPGDPIATSEVFSIKRIRLYQAISVERYKIIKKYEKEIF